MMSWQESVGPFKSRARWRPLTLFPFIIFINHYILNVIQALQWQVYTFAMSKTWVRTPGLRYSSHYFSTGIHVRFQCQGTAYTFIIHPPTRPSEAIQGLRSKEHDAR